MDCLKSGQLEVFVKSVGSRMSIFERDIEIRDCLVPQLLLFSFNLH